MTENFDSSIRNKMRFSNGTNGTAFELFWYEWCLPVLENFKKNISKSRFHTFTFSITPLIEKLNKLDLLQITWYIDRNELPVRHTELFQRRSQKLVNLEFPSFYYEYEFLLTIIDEKCDPLQINRF